MYISRLHLQSWRNFKELKAELRPRAFVLGPNAVGKSNLFDAIRFLRDVASPGGGLSTAVASRGGVSLIRCLYARRYSDIGFEVAISEDNGEPLWEYQLSIGQNNNRRPIVKSEVVKDAEGTVILQRPSTEDRQDDARLTQTALEQISANSEFRSISDFFQSVFYQHIIPQVVRDPRAFSAHPIPNDPSRRDLDPFGRDFLLRVLNTPRNIRDARLRNITRALRAAIPQLVNLEAHMDSQGVPHLVGGFENWRPEPAKQDEANFSDGTLRLLGLLWSAFEGSGPLLLEEPELSLHPEIVQRLPAMFSAAARMRKIRRQVIISTYSREMLVDEGISADEVLVLKPVSEGTILDPLSEQDMALLETGLTVADVLLSKTNPPALQSRFIFLE